MSGGIYRQEEEVNIRHVFCASTREENVVEIYDVLTLLTGLFHKSESADLKSKWKLTRTYIYHLHQPSLHCTNCMQKIPPVIFCKTVFGLSTCSLWAKAITTCQCWSQCEGCSWFPTITFCCTAIGRYACWNKHTQGLSFLKIITCLTSRILKFFDLLISLVQNQIFGSQNFGYQNW